MLNGVSDSRWGRKEKAARTRVFPGGGGDGRRRRLSANKIREVSGSESTDETMALLEVEEDRGERTIRRISMS